MSGTDLTLTSGAPPDKKSQLAALTDSSFAVSHQRIDAAQTGNNVTGDLAGGNIDKRTYVSAAVQLTAMTRVIQEFAHERAQDARLNSVIANLEHYLNATTTGDVRGLDEKLTSAGRASQLQTARIRKHEATQFILRHQSSIAAQKIIGFLLGKLLTAFENHVSPLINASAPPAQIDSAIQVHVLDAAWTFLESNPLEVDHRLLTGLLYFLGGNCHIRWDPC